MSKKILTPELTDKILALRLSGLTREQVAEALGVKLSLVKTAQIQAGLSLPMEQRQQNALRGKLAKNPRALEDMRKTACSPEANAKRSRTWVATLQTEKGDEIRARSSAQSSARWASRTASQRTKYRGSDVLAVAQNLGMTCSIPPAAPVPQSIALVCGCGRTFSARSFDFLYGKIRSCGCVKSQAEGEIADWLQQKLPSSSVQQRDRKIIAPFELDIWLPDQRLAVEYCGVHYHSDLYKSDLAEDRHLNKLEACEALGIRLVTIFSDEWINKQEVCKAYLSSMFGIFDSKIGARSCVVAPTEPGIARAFLSLHHLQGAGAEARHWGLWHRDELVAVSSFRDRGEGVWEMTRYCVKGHLQIVGGFQRLLKTASKSLAAVKVVTFADRRWSNGGVYRRAGFEQAAVLAPGYWYVKNGSDKHRWHKSLFRKARIAKALGLQEGETERAAMARHGHSRIWDCGIVRWELSLTSAVDPVE